MACGKHHGGTGHRWSCPVYEQGGLIIARINTYKKSARGKAIKCSKCGKLIEVGETYLKATPFKLPAIIRCFKCGLKGYETSGSEYIRAVGALVEDWQDDIGISEDTAEELISAIEDIRDQCQESLDNMPEQLQESDSGTTLQERIDACDAAIEELEQVSWDDCNEDAEEEAKEEMGGFYDPNVHDYENEDAFKVALEALTKEKAEEAFAEAIDDALSSLEY